MLFGALLGVILVPTRGLTLTGRAVAALYERRPAVPSRAGFDRRYKDPIDHYRREGYANCPGPQ